MNERKVVFRLKRGWQMEDGRTVDLYEEYRSGRKTIEYRDLTDYWLKRLCDLTLKEFYDLIEVHEAQPYEKFVRVTKRWLVDLTNRLVVKRAWLTVGMPKNNLPRFEADIIKLIANIKGKQLEVYFDNVEEILTNG